MVKRFIKKYQVRELTIVSDAEMTSSDVKQLIENNINYIVGARLGNISEDLLKKITHTNFHKMVKI